MREGADVGPGDLVGALAEVLVAEGLSRVSIVSISAFFETKTASASSFDLRIRFQILVIIFGSSLIVRLMNASFERLIQRKIDLLGYS